MLKGIRNSIILTSLLYIVLGVVLIVFPEVSLGLACILIGAVTLIYGVVRIVAFVRDGGEASGRFDLFVGVLLAALGIFLLVCPQVIVSLIPIALGIYIIVDSVSAVKKALDLKALGFEHWWVSFLVALALLILGAVMVRRPAFRWSSSALCSCLTGFPLWRTLWWPTGSSGTERTAGGGLSPNADGAQRARENGITREKN